MDNKASCKEVAQEVTREVLIAISDSQPEKILNSKIFPEKFQSEDRVPAANGDGLEKFISELISISYSSPDVMTSPVAPENHNGHTNGTGKP